MGPSLSQSQDKEGLNGSNGVYLLSFGVNKTWFHAHSMSYGLAQSGSYVRVGPEHKTNLQCCSTQKQTQSLSQDRVPMLLTQNLVLSGLKYYNTEN